MQNLDVLKDTTADMTIGTVVYVQEFERVSSQDSIELITEKSGWISSINRPAAMGIYAYHPPIAHLITCTKRLIRKIANSYGFEEHIFPRHYDMQDLRSFGWVGNAELASQLMVIRPLTSARSDVRGNDFTISDPLQCIGFYAMLLHTQTRLGGHLPSEFFDEGPFCVYEDQGGWTLRNETTERLSLGWGTSFEFSGAEFVFAGSIQQVYDTRWAVLSGIAQLLTELHITHRIVVAKPCSHAQPGKNSNVTGRRIFEADTLDIQAYIPQYEGSRDPWLELGGGDVAGDTLTSAFGLRVSSGAPLYSGCQGLGWQRFALAVLSQFGMDPLNWPGPLQAEYGLQVPESRISKLYNSLSSSIISMLTLLSQELWL